VHQLLHMRDLRVQVRNIRWAPMLGGAVGVALAAWLLKSYGVRHILELLGHAGLFGVLAITAFHGLQMLASALGWRAIAARGSQDEPLRIYLLLRWIREGVNNLLPLAQIGGEVVAWNLLRQRGAKPAVAIAGTVADLTMEMVTQIVFTILGVLLLFVTGADVSSASIFASGLLIATLFMVGLFVALRLGFAELIENALLRLGRLMGWAGAAHIEGLNQALMECYRKPRRVMRSGFWHLLSWLLGGLEVWLALKFLGQHVDLGTGLVIESLGQAAKALGFAIPGALGIQEGGYVMVCSAFGLPAELGIALSLMKRLREVILGVPALVAWQHFETRMRALNNASVRSALP
jgi:putative membrane protein